MKANGDLIAEYKVTLVKDGGLLRTSVLTITSCTNIDSNDDRLSLLIHLMGIINFFKDYAPTVAINMFYYAETSDFANIKTFKCDSNSPLLHTTKLNDVLQSSEKERLVQ